MLQLGYVIYHEKAVPLYINLFFREEKSCIFEHPIMFICFVQSFNPLERTVSGYKRSVFPEKTLTKKFESGFHKINTKCQRAEFPKITCTAHWRRQVYSGNWKSGVQETILCDNFQSFLKYWWSCQWITSSNNRRKKKKT